MVFMAMVVPAAAFLVKGEAEQEEPLVLPHDPISFDGSTYNGSLPGGIAGNGTETDPFYIYGHWINTSGGPGIVITNSSYHFVIQTCLFTGVLYQNHSAILIRNSSNVYIDYVYVYKANRGIEIAGTENVIISRSGSFGCVDGIYVQGQNVSISQCLLKVNIESGIKINQSMNVTIDNVISDGNTAILGVTAGIYIMNSHFVSIRDTTCSLNYGFGILVETTISSFGLTHISISDSYIDSNNNGIVFKGVGSSVIEDSVIQHNTNGIHMTNGGNVDITGCRFYKNTYGVFLSDSRHVNIESSTFEKNENAVYLDSTNRTTISGNQFNNGTWHAITIDTWLDLGPPSSWNVVYENVFKDNGPIGSQVMDNGINNKWSQDRIGNTWHDHPGPDSDDNDIVDVPYEIDGLANSTDPYPKAVGGIIEADDDIDEPVSETDESDEALYWIIFGAVLTVVLFFVVLTLLAGIRTRNED
jgi:parallel beta-helix repeat protein